MRQKRMHSCCMGMSKAAGRSSSRLANRSIQLASKRISQSSYDEVKAKIAQARTLAQQKMAKSIKPSNFYKELREMELNDKQQ